MKFAALIAVAITIAAPAMAQWTTRPMDYNNPRNGSITTGPNGIELHTVPADYNNPRNGSITTGPAGLSCTTRPADYNNPQNGSITTCN